MWEPELTIKTLPYLLVWLEITDIADKAIRWKVLGVTKITHFYSYFLNSVFRRILVVLSAFAYLTQ